MQVYRMPVFRDPIRDAKPLRCPAKHARRPSFAGYDDVDDG